MNSQKLVENSKKYYERLKLRYPPQRADGEYIGDDQVIWLRHACWLAQNTPGLLIVGKIKKASRWLSAAQNLMLAHGVYSIKDVQIHSMPKEAVYNRDG